MMDNYSIDIFLSTNTLVLLFSDFIIVCLQFLVFFSVIKILLKWDFNSTSLEQYKLEEKSYFVMLILYFTFIIKIILYPYFIYVLDSLSNIIPGAMCGAGVISANSYGEPLLIIKTIILFLSAIWIVINIFDIKQKHSFFMKTKSKIYLILFVFVIVEFILQIKFFSSLSTQSLVTCCSIIYSADQSANGLPFNISLVLLLIVFYLTSILLFISNYKQNIFYSFFLALTFIYFSYYSVIYFFGTYIYELPTHHCPFCMLQKDYYYIGYFIFASLFLTTFFGILNFILKYTIDKTKNSYFKISNIFLVIFITILTSYVICFYIKNGVFL